MILNNVELYTQELDQTEKPEDDQRILRLFWGSYALIVVSVAISLIY